MNFKYLMLAATALTMGFASCSSDDDTNDKVSPKDPAGITLKVVMPGVRTYAETPSIGTPTPKLNDAKVYFTDGVTILRVVSYPNAAGLQGAAGETISNVPTTATMAYIVGNEGVALGTDGQAGPMTDEANAAVNIVDGDPFTKFESLMVRISQQVNPVNQLHLIGKGVFVLTPGATTPVAVDLYPSISRIELAKAEADQTVALPKRVTSFKLMGVYINNTFTMINPLYTAYPAVANHIAYDYQNAAWANPGIYNPAFCDEFAAPAAAVSFAPAVGNVWGYYVVPAQKEVGADYVGTTMNVDVNGVATPTVFGATPVIVLKITEAIVEGAVIPGTKYVSVTRYKDGANAIEHFEAGNVYGIDNILFNKDHLTDEPNIPATVNLTANVTIKPWVNVNTTPEL